MFCTKCGVEVRETDRFCSSCGIRTTANLPSPPGPRHQPLLLDKRNRKIAGVCAGFARYFDVDVFLMRVIVLILAICTGVGFVGYFIAWIVIPSDDGLPQRPADPPGDQDFLTISHS